MIRFVKNYSRLVIENTKDYYSRVENEREPLLFFDFLMILVIAISFFSLLFLAGGFFSVGRVVIISLLAVLLIIKLFYHSVFSSNIITSKHLFFVLTLILVGLFFRGEPYQYIIGGQDQGIYVNMSKAFKKQGGVFQYDRVRQAINEPELKQIYDNTNIYKAVKKRKEYEGFYLPGVYVTNLEQSKYVFQFYHLHPLWLAIFDGVFGEQNAGYALIFFSLISILALYLLAYEITGNRLVAFTTGALLAVNPLHAFFSKFPVTEIVALAFASSSFYYLLRYYNLARQKKYRVDYLILSALLITGMFFTRISGFMYLPFFYLLLVANQLFSQDRVMKREIAGYIFALFLLYGISVLYGLHFSYPYVSDIYQMSFESLLGTSWERKLLLLIAFFFLLYAVVCYLAKIKHAEMVKKILIFGKALLPYLFLIVLLLGMHKVYQLGYTDRFIDDDWLNGVWHLNHIKSKAWSYWSPYVLLVYLSVYLVVLFFYVLLFRNKTLNFVQTMLLVFILFFVAYISILQWKIPYQYYYARYLVSEALPYIILFTVTAITTMKKGKIFYLLLLIFAGIYAVHFSLIQNRGNVADGTYESIKEITRNIDKDDLILAKDIGTEVKMALVYYEDKNVISFQSEELNFLTGETLSKYNDIFVLSWYPYQHEALTAENEVTYRFGLFKHTDGIPEKYYYIIKKLYLYKLDKSKWVSFLMNSKKRISIKASPVNREGFFTDSVWTTNSAKIDGFDFNITDLNYLKLDVYGNNPIYGYDPDKMGLEISLNGKKLKYHSQKEGSLYFEIDDQDSAHEVTIHTKTFVPKSHQINEDDRALGIDIKSISFIKEIKQ